MMMMMMSAALNARTLAAGWDPGVYGLKTQAHTELTLGGLEEEMCRGTTGAFLRTHDVHSKHRKLFFFHSFHIVSI